MSGVLKLSLEDTKPKTPKRRGRGTFSYKKEELYSDNLSDKSIIDNLEDEDVSYSSERNAEIRPRKLLVTSVQQYKVLWSLHLFCMILHTSISLYSSLEVFVMK